MNNFYQADESKLKQVNGGRFPMSGRPRFNSTGRSHSSSISSQVSDVSHLSLTQNQMIERANVRPASSTSSSVTSSSFGSGSSSASSAGGGGGGNGRRRAGIALGVLAGAGIKTAGELLRSDVTNGTHFYGNWINSEE